MPRTRFLLALLVLFAGCDTNRDTIVAKQRAKVGASIHLGDDIHEAEQKLIQLGFRIEYGPDFPTKSRDYLMMIVDYGVQPNGLETFKHTIGMEGSDELIDGVIEADPQGKITSIK